MRYQSRSKIIEDNCKHNYHIRQIIPWTPLDKHYKVVTPTEGKRLIDHLKVESSESGKSLLYIGFKNQNVITGQT